MEFGKRLGAELTSSPIDITEFSAIITKMIQEERCRTA